jgi:transposase
MTLDPEKAAEIRRLHVAEHWKVGTIAAQLHLHHEVVERVLGLTPKAASQRASPDAAAAPTAPTVPARLLPFETFIDETLSQYPRLRSTRLCDMLRERGYEGGERSVRRYVQRVRPAPKAEVFLRTEPLIAEQSQIDWAYVDKRRVEGGTRQLWVFVLVLSYSRALWAELVMDLSATALRRSLVRACVYFGGATRQWLFDNPKVVVLERHGDAVRFHPDLLALAGQLCVAPRLCGVRKPQQKGRVERAIRFLRDRFFAGPTLPDVERGNVELLAFLEGVANARPHPRWPTRTVREVLVEEQARLLALPDPLPSTDLLEPIAIDKTAFARFETNRYSVPPAHANATLSLVASDTALRFLDGDKEVARHPRSWGRAQVVEAPEHRTELLEHKRAAREAKGRDRLGAAIPGFDTLLERWVDGGRNVGCMTAKVLRLLDLYGDAIVAAAAGEAITRGTHDPRALAVLCEERRRATDAPVPLDIDLGAHVPDRDVIPHDLESYDAQRRHR